MKSAENKVREIYRESMQDADDAYNDYMKLYDWLKTAYNVADAQQQCDGKHDGKRRHAEIDGPDSQALFPPFFHHLLKTQGTSSGSKGWNYPEELTGNNFILVFL